MSGRPWCRRQWGYALGKEDKDKKQETVLIQQQRGHGAVTKGKENDQSELMWGGRGGEEEAGDWLAQSGTKQR